ncbi:hypothetical protein KIL84_009374 [Mauremys mutica]|uniref:Uncharacterized protein n=1 Tax=Mauremys mutica TaxID=74926 RepID=A0A9D4B3X3_9SAUR|nr:hypothetical protein KIL84_009374 [Mauremys mutica]
MRPCLAPASHLHVFRKKKNPTNAAPPRQQGVSHVGPPMQHLLLRIQEPPDPRDSGNAKDTQDKARFSCRLGLWVLCTLAGPSATVSGAVLPALCREQPTNQPLRRAAKRGGWKGGHSNHMAASRRAQPLRPTGLVLGSAAVRPAPVISIPGISGSALGPGSRWLAALMERS